MAGQLHRDPLSGPKLLARRASQDEGENTDRNPARKTVRSADSFNSYVNRMRRSRAHGRGRGAPRRRSVPKSARVHRASFLLSGLFLLVLTVAVLFNGCSVILDGLFGVINSSTYPLEDPDIYAAEAQYRAMETELLETARHWAETHDYDEVILDLDELFHDPYVLISALTALHGGEWKSGEIQGELQLLLETQYRLEEHVEIQTRFREEERTGVRFIASEDGSLRPVPYTETVLAPYPCTICTLRLENTDLSHVPSQLMNEDQLGVYAMYMAVLGNRPDLFPDSNYVNLYFDTEYPVYEIPADALTDEAFAAMIREAEQYLGFPYVWGGSSPQTSFDCSGFVSWVLNHSGWSVGRPTAEGLRTLCAPVGAAQAQPGDLIFFENTYNTPGASHVGIYVGDGMMIHCGDPIQYASIETPYWQDHFLSFGRLPDPS